MRRVALTPAFLALLSAFLMAPYQHIHLHSSGGRDVEERHHHPHDDGAFVHAHFYAVSVPEKITGGVHVEESRGGHASQSLDTFRTMPQGGFPALLRPESRLLLSRPAELLAGTVEVVEPCGHDPPLLDLSVPRAPPV